MLQPNCSSAAGAAEVAAGLAAAAECGLGTLGNAVALWTFFFRPKVVGFPTPVYLLNLVLADLLLASLPALPRRFYLGRKS